MVVTLTVIRSTEDCDDSSDQAYPGADDNTGDGIDQSCDSVDGMDADGDGYASTDSGGLDCNDSDATISPESIEVPDDGIDQDCDGQDESSATAIVRNFSLPDENPGSATFGQLISPRDYMQQISGWYFIKAT